MASGSGDHVSLRFDVAEYTLLKSVVDMKDGTIGIATLVGSVIGIVAYGWFLLRYPIAVLQSTAFVIVAGILIIVAWIGWAMASTSSVDHKRLDSSDLSQTIVESNPE